MPTTGRAGKMQQHCNREDKMITKVTVKDIGGVIERNKITKSNTMEYQIVSGKYGASAVKVFNRLDHAVRYIHFLRNRGYDWTIS